MEIKQENLTIPRHVAIITDGNGRWAKKRGLPRTMGHREGCATLEKIVDVASKMGIKYLTVFAFSTENWKRSQEEVGALMQLFRYYMVKLLKVAEENQVKVCVIGERKGLDEDIIDGIQRLERETSDYKGPVFTIALNYGGRDEIVRAAKRLFRDAKEGLISESQIDEALFSSYLDTKLTPDPDLLIRTSGEIRISNFLLWQLAYTEIYVTDCLWPDFNKEELEKAIIQYNNRDRRFGGAK